MMSGDIDNVVFDEQDDSGSFEKPNTNILIKKGFMQMTQQAAPKIQNHSEHRDDLNEETLSDDITGIQLNGDKE